MNFELESSRSPPGPWLTFAGFVPALLVLLIATLVALELPNAAHARTRSVEAPLARHQPAYTRPAPGIPDETHYYYIVKSEEDADLVHAAVAQAYLSSSSAGLISIPSYEIVVVTPETEHVIDEGIRELAANRGHVQVLDLRGK